MKNSLNSTDAYSISEAEFAMKKLKRNEYTCTTDNFMNENDIETRVLWLNKIFNSGVLFRGLLYIYIKRDTKMM